MNITGTHPECWEQLFGEPPAEEECQHLDFDENQNGERTCAACGKANVDTCPVCGELAVLQASEVYTSTRILPEGQMNETKTWVCSKCEVDTSRL